MEKLNLLIESLSGFVWNNVLILLLVGTGIFFTITLKFVQLRKFKDGYKRAIKGADLNGEKAGVDGMSSFQSLATAIAAQVGTGNLAGAATAIASGGPGAIFWMWVSAFFGMATVYAEAVLGQIYKKRVEGEIVGGPAYYISEGLGKNKFSKAMAVFFAFSCILALSFMGNAVQSNSIASAFSNVLNISPVYVGIFIAAISGFIFWGGTKRIASFTEKIVPIMAGLYVGTSIIIIILNLSDLIHVLKIIVEGAFNPSAVLGAGAGITVKQAIRYGVARGLFSNEAGMGSTPHAHAVAKVKRPEEQGAVAIITVFIDTFIVLNCTAFIILMSGPSEGLTGIILTQSAFVKVLGNSGGIFIAICLLFFALSTIIGWYYFGVANVKYLFGEKGMLPYKIIVILFILLGSIAKVNLVWNLSDLFNGLMALPNLVALIALYKLVKNTEEKNKL